ncbi:MAG: hypothetical protein KGS72_10875 [Cyanobacteria bacterium REEB67]|nr:hypothetical protein [Cyanobacteria bacterium REEB67]
MKRWSRNFSFSLLALATASSTLSGLASEPKAAVTLSKAETVKKLPSDTSRAKTAANQPKLFQNAVVPTDMMAAIDDFVKHEAKALGGDEYTPQREIGRGNLSSCPGGCFVAVYLLEGVPFRGSNNNTQFLAAFTYSEGKPMLLASCQCGGRGLRYLKCKSLGGDDLKFDTEFYLPKDPMSTPSGRGLATYVIADKHLIEMP